ncbi:MAG: hypothetical protein ACK45Z_24420, partial [Dolichospermum sp.]
MTHDPLPITHYPLPVKSFGRISFLYLFLMKFIAGYSINLEISIARVREHTIATKMLILGFI